MYGSNRGFKVGRRFETRMKSVVNADCLKEVANLKPNHFLLNLSLCEMFWCLYFEI